MALTNGPSEAARYASERWRDTPEVGLYLDRATAGLTSTTSGGTALIAPGTAEFLGLVRPRTVIGRLTQIQKVPFHRGAAIASGGAVYTWIGEGSPTPVGKLSWTPASLPVRKAGGIAVASRELLKLTTPSAEAAFTRQLADGLVNFTDAAFLSADAEVSGIAPAGILDGVAGTATAGNVATDLEALLDGYTSLEGVAVIISEKSAIALAGQGAFRDGKLYGTLPVVLSSAAGTNLIAVDMRRVLLADEGELEIDIAHAATLEMEEEPTDPTTSGVVMVSMFQANASAIKVLRFINWQALDGAVRLVTGVTY
ncbi:MAG: phage major capsid protein [Gemmatimonadaceae bacterium]